MTAALSVNRYRRLLAALAGTLLLATLTAAQTKIVAPNNRYPVSDDVRIGKEAVAEVTKELPMLNDERLDDYVETIGAKLAAAIPAEFQHPEFRYSFDVVNQQEINAFALPGGPMFLNRGMIEAAKTEGEVAGVMGHEISHVALRHGTAQATSGQKFQIGSILGQVGGAILGGTLGNVISQGSQIGAGLGLMKYSRAYESQADILGAQILARAGYDPREMANMFKTLEAEGGSRGPEWFSSHPNPGNRFEAINNEARSLRVQGNGSTGQFQSIQARLRNMPPAYTAEQIAKGQAKTGAQTANTSTGNTGNSGNTSNIPTRTSVKVPPPSPSYRSSRPLNFLRLRLPENWKEVSGDADGVTYAPEGGFFQSRDGNTAFTHGVQIGLVPKATGDLQRDTNDLVTSLTRSNTQLRANGGYTRDSISGRRALRTTLSNISEVTGQRESVSLTATELADGRLLFLIGVAPQNEANAYETVFRRVRQSVELSDR
ncbi:MAG TPA: M48 family metalloprotease [Vicinamibacterales bacterium]|nr:M48 family metalloprotease [Vicinamibacterales bacterium]